MWGRNDLGGKRIGGETSSGGETTRGETTKGKRPRGKRLGGETTRGGNGLVAKRLGFLPGTFGSFLFVTELYGLYLIYFLYKKKNNFQHMIRKKMACSSSDIVTLVTTEFEKWQEKNTSDIIVLVEVMSLLNSRFELCNFLKFLVSLSTLKFHFVYWWKCSMWFFIAF